MECAIGLAVGGALELQLLLLLSSIRCLRVTTAERDKDGVSRAESPVNPVSRLQSSDLRQRLLQPVQRQEVFLRSRVLSSRTGLQRCVRLVSEIMHRCISNRQIDTQRVFVTESTQRRFNKIRD